MHEQTQERNKTERMHKTERKYRKSQFRGTETQAEPSLGASAIVGQPKV